ncbi:MAG TPA: hypothetical protein VHA73_00955 [Acidimicrobiales bacterium]|nr:hypothetical protein [Acidimicrobiales bacterium]
MAERLDWLMADPAGPHTVLLEPIAEDPPQDTMGAPSAQLDYEPVSRATPPRLTFTLRLSNDTAGDVVFVSNPYEGLTYSLSDADDWPVAVDRPVREAKIEGTSPSRSARRSYLAVDGVEVAGEAVDPGVAIEDDEIQLAPGDSLVYRLAVEQRTGRDDDKAGPLTEGKYTLRVLLPLSLLVGGEPRDLILRSPEVGISVASRS